MTTMDDKNERLKSFDNSKLMDIVKNYRQYGYDDNLRNTAIDILKSRGISEDDLKLTGNFENQQYNSARDIAGSYFKNSHLTFLFYGIILVAKIFTPLVARSSEFLGWTFLIVNILSLFLFLIFLIKSFINHNDFYKAIGKELGTGDQLIYFIVGMPLYFFMYFYYRRQIKEELKLIK
jgi:hypothetical protein